MMRMIYSFCNTIRLLQIHTNAFWIKSASEVFQKKNESVVEGTQGDFIVADDIIVAGATLFKSMIRFKNSFRKSKVCFNFDKLQLRVTEVKYLDASSQLME